ncbi:NAD(P)/FAD-dependent oxidoreductase [soil metagenome]
MSDVLIVGGGLSGAAAAVLLARAGRGVHVLERQSEPAPKICGEFLSIEAQQHLAALGIDLDHRGAPRIGWMRIIWDGATVEAALPFTARGLGRSELDEALIELAGAAGATVERGVRATHMAGAIVQTSVGERGGATLLLATGKHRIREDGPSPKMPAANAHAGFKMHWRLSPADRPALDGVIELLLFPGGYAGLQMVSADTANLCLAIRKDRLLGLGGRWEDVLAMLGTLSPAIRRLADAQPLFARPATIANLSYGHLHRGDADESAYRLGDQAAMTASLTGDGMAIALRSAWLAARHVVDHVPADVHHRRFRAMVHPQVKKGMYMQAMTESSSLGPLGRMILSRWPAILPHLVRATRLPEVALCDV